MKILDKNAVLSQTCDVKKLENPDFKNAIFFGKVTVTMSSFCMYRNKFAKKKNKNHVTVREK